MDKKLTFYFAFEGSSYLKTLFQHLTEYGKGKYYLVPSTIMLVYGFITKKRKWIVIGGFIFVSVAISGITVNLLKFIFGKLRPKALLDYGKYGFHPFCWGYICNSFPSGHSATVWSFFTSVGYIIKNFKFKLRVVLLIILIFWAILVSFSRVAVGAHYLSDVLAGALLGIFVTSFIYYKLFKNWI